MSKEKNNKKVDIKTIYINSISQTETLKLEFLFISFRRFGSLFFIDPS